LVKEKAEMRFVTIRARFGAIGRRTANQTRKIS
jgi:hypothetical protein